MKQQRRALPNTQHMVQLMCCARPGSLENGESDCFYLSDSYFWELVSTLAFVCPPHFTEQVHLQRHQHTQTPVIAPCFGGTLTGICSFPCFPTMLQEYPEIQLRQVIHRSYESTFHPLLLIYQNPRVQTVRYWQRGNAGTYSHSYMT